MLYGILLPSYDAGARETNHIAKDVDVKIVLWCWELGNRKVGRAEVVAEEAVGRLVLKWRWVKRGI